MKMLPIRISENFSSFFFLSRDRVTIVWQAVRDHLYNLIVNTTEHTFLVERAVVGLLRIAIRLLRREEIASQVTDPFLFVFSFFFSWNLLWFVTT